jgi:hypothetical protein
MTTMIQDSVIHFKIKSTMQKKKSDANFSHVPVDPYAAKCCALSDHLMNYTASDNPNPLLVAISTQTELYLSTT